MHCPSIVGFLSPQGPSGDTGAAGPAGPSGPRVSGTIISHNKGCLISQKRLMSECVMYHLLFRDLPDPTDPLVRMEELVAMELLVLLVLVEPLDTLDLL